jgi:hypothetical protein
LTRTWSISGSVIHREGAAPRHDRRAQREPAADANRANFDCHVFYDAFSYHAENYPCFTTISLGRIMRDLTRRGITAAPSHLPKGLAFEIADLILMKGWADVHNFRMAVRLDHGTVGEEYEEVLAFHPEMSSPCQLIVWRNSKDVFVQPLVGRRRRYGSVAAALASMASKPRTILSDILAPSWPTDRARLT